MQNLRSLGVGPYMSPRHYENLSVGESQTAGQYEVTREEIVRFARRWDPQPFHVDETAAGKTHFGELIASGWHTAAVAMRLGVRELFGYVATRCALGASDLRWPHPVYPGDWLTARLTIVEKRASESRPDLGIIKTKWELINEHGQQVFHVVGTSFVKRDD